MEIKTTEELEHWSDKDGIDGLYFAEDGSMTKKGQKIANNKWVPTKDITEWCNAWFDKKRHNNDMFRMNNDELSSLFLDELEAELKKKED